MKEVRLNLQRQISELQQQLQLAKEQHQANLTKLKLEYGRDLGALHKSHLRKEEELLAQMEAEYEQKVNALEDEKKHVIGQLTQEFESNIEQERKEKERAELVKSEYEREIKMIQKKSTQNAQGGWGTFSIVFEDNPKKHHPLVLPGQPQPAPINNSANSNRRKSNAGADDNNSQKSEDAVVDLDGKISPEQLSHFIEVGLLLDQKNFKMID